MRLSERIARIEAQQHLPANVVPIPEPRERRATPRWIQWTQENQANPNAGKSYDRFGGADAA